MEAIRWLSRKDPGCYVACPRRYDENHPLYEYRVEPRKNGRNVFERQTLWERCHIKAAMCQGCLIFWLAGESKTNPRPKEEGPYARDTLGEVARYLTHWTYGTTLNIAIGAENGFHGLSQILCNHHEDCNDAEWTPMQFWHTLAGTVDYAVKTAKSNIVVF